MTPSRTTREIAFTDCLDDRCAGASDAEYAAYQELLAPTIAEFYRGSSVTVQTAQISRPACVVTDRNPEGRILPIESEKAEEIGQTVIKIAGQVWEAGEFRKKVRVASAETIRTITFTDCGWGAGSRDA